MQKEMIEKIYTNCFLIKIDPDGNPEQVCLAMKKRGFGQGMWNGSGGKPEENETIESTAKREIEEEFKVIVQKLEKRGEISFVLKKEQKHVLMHTYLSTDWKNEPAETEEMDPKWFRVHEVPYKQMWKSDEEWLPIILSGKKIIAEYTYAYEGGEVETRKIHEVNSFE